MNINPVFTEYTDAETFIFPDAITLKILLSGTQTNGQYAIFEDIVEPGIGPPRHIHHNQDEIFFFLEGSFDAEVGGKLYHPKPKDVVLIPKGTIHAFKNVGDQPGRLRYVFSPAQTIETMFREFYAAMQSGDFSEQQMADIAMNHGQEIVGPPL